MCRLSSDKEMVGATSASIAFGGLEKTPETEYQGAGTGAGRLPNPLSLITHLALMISSHPATLNIMLLVGLTDPT